MGSTQKWFQRDIKYLFIVCYEQLHYPGLIRVVHKWWQRNRSIGLTWSDQSWAKYYAKVAGWHFIFITLFCNSTQRGGKKPKQNKSPDVREFYYFRNTSDIKILCLKRVRDNKKQSGFGRQAESAVQPTFNSGLNLPYRVFLCPIC